MRIFFMQTMQTLIRQSDDAVTQAYLILIWAHMSGGTISAGAAHL